MTFSLINNNASLNSQSRLTATSNQLNQTLQRLSSGLRINKSGDDAAGLAIANTFRNDIAQLTQGVRNANDGVSSLQIVDGGLNTISGLLDRATTLASQSASDTFTGNRDTLQAELSKVLKEVDRQAAAIGLSDPSNYGADAARLNKDINVYIGGGKSVPSAGTFNDNQVSIDLSGSDSRVDTVSLGINGISIGNSNGTVAGSAAAVALTSTETLTFQYADVNGALQSTSVSIANGSSPQTSVDTVNANSSLKAAGITASLDAGGKFTLSSSKVFTVSESGSQDLKIAAGVQISGNAYNTGTLAVGAEANTSAGVQQITFTGDSIKAAYGVASYTVNVNIASGNTAAQNQTAIFSAINNDATLNKAGIYAVADSTTATDVHVVSDSKFNFSVAAATGGSSDALTVATNTASGSPSGVVGGSDAAKDALVAIKQAIASLGAVQGKVGAGQNNLAQAIDLATSQLSSFQAAESSIRDADVAADASNLARLTTLQQAGVAALAQANQSSQAILSLLR